MNLSRDREELDYAELLQQTADWERSRRRRAMDWLGVAVAVAIFWLAIR